MKTMTCKQLGGACDMPFKAATFEEIAMLSQEHGKRMFQQQDADHLAAMKSIQQLMQTPGAMEQWQKERQAEFDALPDS